MRSSSSPRARWNRLEQAEQAAPPAARRGAERDRGIAFVRAAALSCRRGSAGGITHSIPDFRSVCAGGPLERCSVSRADVDVALAA